MELSINSPAYYTEEFGVIDEIYWICRKISHSVENKNYSDTVDIVGVIPIVAPASEINKGLFKERTKYDLKYRLVIVCKQIDFNIFMSASLEEKKDLIVKNILQSIKSISRKAKINYVDLEKDILSALSEDT